MRRTPEQIEADHQLTAAIERSLAAQGMLDSGEVTEEYVVVVATQRIHEEGDVEYAYATLLRDGQISTTRAVGLLAVAESNIKNQVDQE